MQKENPYLILWRTEAEKNLHWGNSEEWKDYDFDQLSDHIFEKTDVRLSVSTLKRIWGKVRYESSPNTATLNALAKYLGYADWRDYQQKNPWIDPAPQNGNGNKVPVTIGYPADAPINNRKKKYFIPAIIILAAIISLGLISLITKKNSNARAFAEAKFQAHKVTDDLPNSVVFDYDATAFHSNEVYIQQNWDPSRRSKVDPNGKQFTSIYYSPGYFQARLIVDGEIVKKSDVWIKTKGWVGLIAQKPVPFYLSNAEMKQDGSLGVTAKTFSEKTGSHVFTDQWAYFNNVREFEGVSAEDFSLETTLRNTSTLEQSPCRKVEIYVLGVGSAIIIPLSAKGCISDINLLSADGNITGKEHDLSAFGCDMDSFHHVNCTVSNHFLQVFLDEKLIYSMPQLGDVNRVVGIRIGFEGAGEIKDVKLSSKRKVAYEERF